MRQKDLFLAGEGDKWLARNRNKMGTVDEVSIVIKSLDLIDMKPSRVLEIGCADGWRLAKLRNEYGCEVMGVDPSQQAVTQAAARFVPAYQMDAAGLPLCAPFDLIIFGFCLYLTDPEDWFFIVSESDRLLKPGGHLLIHDFAADPDVFAREYKHNRDILSYHFDFARLWLAHPLYRKVTSISLAGTESITVLEKLPKKVIEVVS